MTARKRRWLKRKWQQAADNCLVAQEHLLDARQYYIDTAPQHVALTDSCLELLEQTKHFILDASKHV